MPDSISPRSVLDEAKRHAIIALLANGHSRRSAARFVGCSPTTITRTALRDREFADRIARAEQRAEINLLGLVQGAAKTERYWRAAAWLLERRNPADFAARPPRVFNGPQVIELLVQFLEVISEDVPEESYERAMAKIERLTAELNEVEFPAVPTPPAEEPEFDHRDQPIGDLPDLDDADDAEVTAAGPPPAADASGSERPSE
jgi:hypothetical protein